MAKVCQICQKRPSVGFQISHSHRKTKRRFLPNIQKKKMIIDGQTKRVKICARCLKAQTKAK